MNVSLVIGAGYGDEGKGSFVNYLCGKHENPLVVRFNGGHQVGHTVVHNSIRHTFSNFGSGTLRGVPTYWSEYCTVNPTAVLKEGNALRAQGITPKVIYSPNAMVTTPFDIYRNMQDSTNMLHGSVGVGFGATIQRNADHYKLYVRDLLYPNIRDIKLNLIREYMNTKIGHSTKHFVEHMNKAIEEFIVASDDLVNRFKIATDFGSLSYDSFIFEGGQGIMLDMDYGFFPHVTRSNTTSKNAIEMLNKLNIVPNETYYITRAYQTRHGNGPMINENMDISYIKENPLEANVNGGAQGIFKKSVLDINMLRYALDCDLYHNQFSNKNLVVTCLDQVPDFVSVTNNGKLISSKKTAINKLVGIRKQFSSYSDKGCE